MNRQKTIYESKPDSVPSGRALQQCHCGKWYSLPACHAKRHKSCSVECKQNLSSKRSVESAERRRRNCEKCGKSFVPRQWQIDTGGGRFCSHDCASQDLVQRDYWKAAMPKRIEGTKRAMAEGRIPIRRGPEHHQWNGGPIASRRRRTESGKAAAQNRAYRAANRERVKDWAHVRQGRKLDRLPYGTIPSLYEKQKAKCAFCQKSIRSGYHVDHIVPLAKGGRHEPLNLQLLCGPCNVRKWTFHPVEFAQRHGRLL